MVPKPEMPQEICFKENILVGKVVNIFIETGYMSKGIKQLDMYMVDDADTIAETI